MHFLIGYCKMSTKSWKHFSQNQKSLDFSTHSKLRKIYIISFGAENVINLRRMGEKLASLSIPSNITKKYGQE